MGASLRKSDSIAEQALGAFLDEHFYETLHKRDAGFEYERVHDRKRQLKGMDVIVNYHGNRIVIDEKSALHWINRNLRTFSFELSSLQSGHRDPVPGWLYNANAETNRYLLMWVKTWDIQTGQLKEIPLGEMVPENFKEVECVLVERSKVQRYLSRCGWNEDLLMKRAEEIRRHPDNRQLRRTSNSLIRFAFSENLKERPVNVLIERDVLKAIALHVYTVTNAGIVSVS